jgi:hypothetical protein
VLLELPYNFDRVWITAHRFDATGARVGPKQDVIESVREQRPRTTQAALATDGHTLVAYSGEPDGVPNEVHGRWLDRAGVPEGRAFTVGPLDADQKLGLTALGGGAVAVRESVAFPITPAPHWIAKVTGSGAVAVPRWMTGLPAAPQLRGDGRGYFVVLPPPGTFPRPGGCVPRLQIRAPAGNLCAVLGVRGPARELELGLDGTASINVEGGSCGFGGCCRLRWWGGAFR